VNKKGCRLLVSRFRWLATPHPLVLHKVLGADIFLITTLLTKEFFWLVIIANVLSTPFIWCFDNRWLEKYAYKMQLTPVVLILTLSFALFITIVTNIKDIINTMALLGIKKVFCLT